MDNGRIIASLVGREYARVDCWQLVREFYLKVFNLELQAYYSQRPSPYETQSLVKTHAGEFQKVEGEPTFGDIILIAIAGIESHIGVYVGEGRMLHSSRTTGSVIDRLDRWKPRIVGFYRHKVGTTT